jgi:hypothetical protein
MKNLLFDLYGDMILTVNYQKSAKNIEKNAEIS